MKYNGSSWAAVGIPGFSDTTVSCTSITIDKNGTPYVCYLDNPVSIGCGTLMVKKYDGSNWVTVGNTTLIAESVDYPSLAIDGSGIPYVSFTNGTIGPATVYKYYDTSWVLVGATAALSAGGTQYTSIAVSKSGVPYIVYVDAVNGYAATAKKYNGSDWVYAGSGGFSLDEVSNTSILTDTNGTPYVAYNPQSNDGKATVMRYNGSNWAIVGSAGFSTGPADYLSMAMGRNRMLYVVYSDQGFSGSYGPATVMKYDASTEVTSVRDNTFALSAFPNPAENAFGIHVSSIQKEKVSVIITNTLGRKVHELQTTTNTNTQIQLNEPPGVYFISAITKNNSVTSKLIIE